MCGRYSDVNALGRKLRRSNCCRKKQRLLAIFIVSLHFKIFGSHISNDKNFLHALGPPCGLLYFLEVRSNTPKVFQKHHT